MFNWAAFFIVFSLVAAIFGFTGIAGTAAGFAKILFFIGLFMFLLSAIYYLLTGKKTKII